MQEFQRSPCIYHPSEFITNFCKEKTCLMPLCPTCICSHLELHLKGGKTNPVFDNINDSFSSCSKEIKVFSEKFEDGRTQLNGVERAIIEQKKQLAELVYQTKVQVREMVEATFDQLEKDLELAIDKQNLELGLHLPENLDALQKGIIEIGSKLREMNGDLRTDRSLSTLITFNHETRASLTKYENDIFQEIRNNQEYAPFTSVNQEAINRVKQSVSQVISLKFEYPKAIKQQQLLQQAQIQNARTAVKTQQSQPAQHLPQNPSLIHGAPVSDRAPLGASFGTRPSGITSPVKGTVNPSYTTGTRVGEASGATVSQSINHAAQRVSQQQQQVQGSASGSIGGYSGSTQQVDARYKRSDIKVTGGVQSSIQKN